MGNMSDELPDRIIQEYLKTIRENTLWQKVGDEYVISMPFVVASGHFVEIFVREVGDNFIAISDKKNALSDLWLSGVKILGQKRKMVEDILSKYDLSFEKDEVLALAKVAEVGDVFSRVVQALIRIGDLRLLHKVTLVTEERIAKRLRNVVRGIEPRPLAGPRAVLPGRIEPTHQVDFLSLNEHKTAVKAIDARKKLSLQEKVEAWAFKFGDMREADPDVRAVCVYDRDNEYWSASLAQVAAARADIVVAIQEKEEIRKALVL